MKESQIQNTIVNYLTTLGWNVMVTDAGEAARSSRTPHRMGKLPPGTPDLTVMKHGVVFFVEVKGPRGKLTRRQELEHERLRQHGLEVVVARDIEDLEPTLERMERLVTVVKALKRALNQ